MHQGKIIFLSLFFSVVIFQSFGQTCGVTHSGRSTQQETFPVEVFEELPNPAKTDLNKWKNFSGVQIGWGNTDIRYKKEEPFFAKNQTIEINGWRGEKVIAQFIVSNNVEDFDLSFEVLPLQFKKNKRTIISSENISAGFVRFVMTDELNKDKKGGCGYRNPNDFDSSLSADAIDHLTKNISIKNKTSRAVWINIQIPENAQPGNYFGNVLVKKNNKTIKTLHIKLKVSANVLSHYSQWKFHLDLWQNPYAVARYYHVKPWSDAHFEKMKIEMLPYIKAGGKVITASIMHQPWGGQTYDPFESMITWMKKADGTWFFDYTVFDKWVEFMMSLGLDKQINCYSMIPWKLSFQYFDQATNSMQFIKTKPGEKEYDELWTNMLTSFAAHLKEKGWFQKTFISMDERPMEAMLATLKVIKNADKDFKVSLAGALHKELINDLDDYCVALRMKFSPEEIQKRKAEGKITTFYTSCEEPVPNTFTFSNPADNEWFGWYASKENLDGYLRWAYNSWVLEPLLDSRFISWPGGDTYFIYPGGRSSVRLEKLIQGIQSFEKINILKQHFSQTQNQKALAEIEKALQLFDEKNLPQTPSSKVIEDAKKIIRNAGIDF